ncbi:MAG: hypothetical protein EZS28_025102 [Streblomastix strix]|uniref:Uncharacterized protein n=1 Tax=Streblomastix strix TaxID=222440 RepID=A0A5J4VA86_9EUKA|nr:MAG: hypothetical protein EZS28_025102 [Streblomastix strix]
MNDPPRSDNNQPERTRSFSLVNRSAVSYPISIINKKHEDIDLVDIDGYQKKIVKLSDDYNTISLAHVLDQGIWSLESIFQTIEDETTVHFSAIGIVQDSYDIPSDAAHCLQPHTAHMAAFTGLSYSGGVNHKEQDIYGNASFKENQSLRLEFDSDKGTLVLFIDDVQQPVYVSGIKEKVRFIICMHYVGSSCLIRSLKKLPESTYVNIEGRKAVDW